ncbi:MAG: glycosyltransferase family 2 protein [Aureliella sp.]
MPDPRSTTVVVVNYKVADCVVDCIRSLRAEIASCPESRLIVVDNDSQDGSVEAISKFIANEGYEDWASVVASERNGGYAYGNNFAVHLSAERNQDTEFYWLLNPDSTVVPGALTRLLDFMDATPKAGICGSSIEQSDGSLWPICFRFPTIFSEVERGLQFGPATRLLARWKVPREMSNQAAQVDWLPGASTLIRKATLDEVGLLDEGYFLYYEETDFALNALKLGWQCWYVPESRIMHVGGVSTGVSSSEQVDEERHARIPQYIFDSRHRYFRKNHGLAYTMLADAAWLGSYSLRRLRHFFSRRQRQDAPHLMRDSIKNSVFFRWLTQND